ncbi:996_t:CDS:1, partial [Racocetra persica]
ADALRIGCIFATFDEAHTTIERYAAKTSMNVILGRTTKNPDKS